MKSTVLFLAALLVGSAGSAQEPAEGSETERLAEVSDTKQLCADAAAAFGQGKAKEALQILQRHWPLPDEEVDNLIYQTESQLKMVGERFGAPVGSDFVRSETAGDSLVKHVFIAKFENHALRFVCIFYKPEEEWLVNSVQWDDQTALLF